MASLIAGQLTPIGDHAWRVLARNPGMMTGPGTNSYLFGKESLTVIDPGPEDQEHLQALLQASRTLGKPIDQIIVTHTHRDHSPGRWPWWQQPVPVAWAPPCPTTGCRMKAGKQTGYWPRVTGLIVAVYRCR